MRQGRMCLNAARIRCYVTVAKANGRKQAAFSFLSRPVLFICIYFFLHYPHLLSRCCLSTTTLCILMTNVQLVTASSDKDRTAAARVWSNAVIMHTLLHEYTRNNTLVQVCLTCKQGWLYAVERLWMCPKLRTMKQLSEISATSSHTLLIHIGDHSQYGSLVHDLNLSEIESCWDNIRYVDIKHLIPSCKNLKVLNLDMCNRISNRLFDKLFHRNSHLGDTLTNLNMGNTRVSDDCMAYIISIHPKLKTLSVSYTEAGERTCSFIGIYLPGIEWLDISGCRWVTDECVDDIADSCKNLRYLCLRSCPYIIAENAKAIMMERGTDVETTHYGYLEFDYWQTDDYYTDRSEDSNSW